MLSVWTGASLIILLRNLSSLIIDLIIVGGWANRGKLFERIEWKVICWRQGLFLCILVNFLDCSFRWIWLSSLIFKFTGKVFQFKPQVFLLIWNYWCMTSMEIVFAKMENVNVLARRWIFISRSATCTNSIIASEDLVWAVTLQWQKFFLRTLGSISQRNIIILLGQLICFYPMSLLSWLLLPRTVNWKRSLWNLRVLIFERRMNLLNLGGHLRRATLNSVNIILIQLNKFGRLKRIILNLVTLSIHFEMCLRVKRPRRALNKSIVALTQTFSIFGDKAILCRLKLLFQLLFQV